MEAPSLPRRFRKGPEEPGRPGEAAQAGALEAPVDPGTRLVCAACGHGITTASERIPVDGEHEHLRTNPMGITFRFGCFARAPGCDRAGTPVLADTWFAGHAWRFALCGACGVHLGWHWRAPDAELGFFGLILSRLTEVGEDSEAG